MLRRLTDPLGKCLTQDDELGLGPNSLYYDLTGGIQVPPTGAHFIPNYCRIDVRFDQNYYLDLNFAYKVN